jgi:hypothetical protein
MMTGASNHGSLRDTNEENNRRHRDAGATDKLRIPNACVSLR